MYTKVVYISYTTFVRQYKKQVVVKVVGSINIVQVEVYIALYKGSMHIQNYMMKNIDKNIEFIINCINSIKIDIKVKYVILFILKFLS